MNAIDKYLECKPNNNEGLSNMGQKEIKYLCIECINIGE